MSLAVIFNGQGAHYEGMGLDFTTEGFLEAQAVYEKVETLTDYPIRQWIADDIEALAQTKNAQVAIAATSLAIFQSIEAQLPAIDYMAGLSLGEYSSLIASGMLSFDEGFKLLKTRGQLMTEHCQQLRETADIVMAAVLKMPLGEIKTVVDEVNAVEEKLYIANLNSSTQVTIAGTEEAVEEFKTLAKERGYKRIMPLKVEGPFHSPYMAAVCAPYEEALTNVSFKKGKVPVISNVTVQPHTTSEVKDLLVRHLVEPVRWEETIDYFVENGVTKIIQIGPGKTLANLLKREENAPATLVIDKVSDLEKLAAFIEEEK
jgi:[acyl-carrier-protein] S-malonyltransferase